MPTKPTATDGLVMPKKRWEIRVFGDGTALFPPDSAGGRGTCNGRVPALGYTWDDDPARAQPDAWGYRAPAEFVEARRTK